MVNGYYGEYGYGPAFGFTSLYTVIQQWEQFGVFSVLFPLILVFAIVFAILEKIDLFKNRGVHLLIALVLGFFTVANPYVAPFFMALFSNLGLGIAILLALLILLGLALKPDQGAWTGIFTIGGIFIFLVVLGRAGLFRYIGGDRFAFWIMQNSAMLVIGVFVVVVIVAVMMGARDKEGSSSFERLMKK